MFRVGLLIAVALLAYATPGKTADDFGLLTTGACVGPHVDKIVQGNYRIGIKDTVIGDTPNFYATPSGKTVGKLQAGGAYTVKATTKSFLQIVGTHFSEPYPMGTVVGWVHLQDVHTLALRNCN